MLTVKPRRVSGERRFVQRGGDEIGAPFAAIVFRTELGWAAVAGRDEALAGVVFGYPSEERAARMLASHARGRMDRAAGPRWLRGVAELLERYAAGEAVDFSGVRLELDNLTPFARQVVAVCRGIPRGEVRTYGELAAACGSPGAARAVGSVMAKNRHPLVVPCHRVVGAGGGLGGYSAPEGLRMKRRLLAMEGYDVRVQACEKPAG
jgi:methylated-DNA-[protein]-cysteine S-methyltransferase